MDYPVDPREIEMERFRLVVTAAEEWVGAARLCPVSSAHVSQAVALIRAAQAALELAQYAQASALAEGRR